MFRHALALAVLPLLSCQPKPAEHSAPHADLLDADGRYVLLSPRHLIDEIPAINDDGQPLALIEIPAGTNAKWEVNKETGNLHWEFREDEPRIVAYLPYPANYGTLPATFSDPATGGDGDPLDIILLGPAVPRGSLLPFRPIGVIHLIDQGERDDKIIGVTPNTAFSDLTTLAELETRFPGVLQILTTWFSHYKGPGASTTISGVGEADQALEVLAEARAAYQPPTAAEAP